MELAAWTVLLGALGAGFVCLRLCEAILQSTTPGIGRLAADGLHRMALDSSLSSEQRSSVASSAWYAWHGTPWPLMRPARSAGLPTVRPRLLSPFLVTPERAYK